MPGPVVHTTAIVLSAVDKASRTINRVFNQAEDRVVKFQKRADTIARTASGIGRDTAAIGIAAAAPLVLATKKAIDFEEAMADVSKVLNLQQGSEELANMGAEAQKLAVHLAKTPSDAAALVASLAQGGTAKGDLFEVGKFAGEMAVAFDIMAETAGDSFTKTKNALAITNEETMGLMNSINFLSDRVAAKAPQILDFMASGGAASAKMAGITGPAMASLGAYFITVGKSGSEAATIMSRFTRGLLANTKAGKIFRDAGGGMEGMMKVLEAGNKLTGTKRSEFFAQFGLYGLEIDAAAKNMANLQKVTALTADSTQYADSVAGEFANRANTRAFELRRLQTQLETTGIKIGNAVLPVISKLAAALTPLLERVSTWIEKNPELTAQIVKWVAIFAGANLAISGIAYTISGAARVVSVLAHGAGFLVKAIRLVGTAVAFVGRMIIANPIGAAVAAIAVAAYLIYKHWEPIKAFFIDLWNTVKYAFSSAYEYITGLKDKFFTAGANIIRSIWEGIKSLAMKPVEAIQDVVSKIRDHLPFSPARVGPLKDIHRLKLVETIAQTIKAKPAVAAMQQTMGDIATSSQGGGLMPSLAGGSGIQINFNPSININGSGGSGNVKDQILQGLRSYSNELLTLIEDAQRRKNRLKF